MLTVAELIEKLSVFDSDTLVNVTIGSQVTPIVDVDDRGVVVLLTPQTYTPRPRVKELAPTQSRPIMTFPKWDDMGNYMDRD